MAQHGKGPVTGPERDRLLSKMFGTAYLSRPAGGLHEGDSAAKHIRQVTPVPQAMAGAAVTDPESLGFLAVRALNRLLAEGRIPDTAAFSVVFPVNTEEREMREYVRAVRDAVSSYALPVAIGSAELSRGEVSQAFGSVFASGDRKLAKTAPEDAELSIIQCGETAAWDTLRLYREREELLVLPKHFREGAEALRKCLDLSHAILTGYRNGAALMEPVERGGIFTALWELGERTRLGMETELPEILISQQTIEACEILDQNPYLLGGGGSVLMVTAEPKRLLSALWEAELPAAKIGCLHTGAARLVRNGDEVRNLEPYRG